jgi:hypothetical protein
MSHDRIRESVVIVHVGAQSIDLAPISLPVEIRRAVRHVADEADRA